MKTITENYAADLYGSEPDTETAPGTFLLSRIGEDLRHHCSSTTGAVPPRKLRELAEAIDARRREKVGDV